MSGVDAPAIEVAQFQSVIFVVGLRLGQSLTMAILRQRGSKSNPVAGHLRPRCGAPWQIRTAREAPHGPVRRASPDGDHAAEMLQIESSGRALAPPLRRTMANPHRPGGTTWPALIRLSE